MNSTGGFILAREGYGHIAASLVLAVVVHIFAGFWWALPFWLLLLFCLQFFRDPRRQSPEGDHLVLSPADGKVVFLGPATDDYTNREALKISVFMNVFSVHSNRAPVAGEVVSVNHFPGRFFNAALDKASLQNERNAMVLRTESGQTVTSVQIAGLIARRILCYVKAGDRLKNGERYGFIRFGSRVDVYLPPGSRIRAELGQSVTAGVDVLAELENQPGRQPVASR